jgi:hypothetical protein
VRQGRILRERDRVRDVSIARVVSVIPAASAKAVLGVQRAFVVTDAQDFSRRALGVRALLHLVCDDRRM